MENFKKISSGSNHCGWGALYLSDASESQEKLVKFLEKVDVKRRIYLVPQWLDVVTFSTSKKQAQWLKEAIDLYVNVDEAAVVRTCKDPKDIGPSLFEARKSINFFVLKDWLVNN